MYSIIRIREFSRGIFFLCKLSVHNETGLSMTYAEMALYFCLLSALIIFDGKNASVGMTNARHLLIVLDTYRVN